MELLKHLTEKFPSLGTWNDEQITAHFLEVFGVDVKVENDLYLFKYNQLAAQWCHKLTAECRGTILRRSDAWKVCARPWNKFWRIDEGHSGLFQDTFMKEWIEKNDPYLLEKCDGTASSLWYDEILKRWRMSTLGTITPFNVGDHPVTFEQLFWEVMQKGNPNFESLDLYKEYTVMCELCTKINRVVTQYPVDSIFLLSIRHKETGEYLPEKDLQFLSSNLNIKLPHKFTFKELGIVDTYTLTKFVEDESVKEEKYGKNSEGFVGYVNGVPLCKIKSKKYSFLHGMCSEPESSVNRAIELFFGAGIDDLYSDLPERTQKFIDGLKQKVIQIRLQLAQAVSEATKRTFESQKDYALFTQSILSSDKRLHGFMFANKELIVTGKVTEDTYNKWLMTHATKWEWKKEIQVT